MIETQTDTNKNESNELTENIVQGIGSVDDFLAAMKSHIDKLKVLHTKHTCDTVGTEFTFSREKLSGKDKKITISGDGKTATQNDTSVKCLWLTTEKGIPTDCDNAVTWAIQITTSDSKNLPEMLMGVGLGTNGFNPLVTGSDSGVIDCGVIPGFWGFSGNNSFNNGTLSNTFDNVFTNGGEYTFTLKPELPVESNKIFTLKITLNAVPASSTEIVFGLDSSIEFIYPIVRFKSNGDKYTFIDAPALPAPAIADAAHIIQKPGVFGKVISMFSGGKSGGITRKHRLRLKKSRNVTRHKGGKKSVRFSARVILNKGNGKGNGKGKGKGNGKGSSSMNKRTRKIASNSYKLSTHPIVKLKL